LKCIQTAHLKQDSKFNALARLLKLRKFIMNSKTQNPAITSISSEQPETIVNPVTGDRMTILHSSLQNDGNYSKIRFDLPPKAEGSPLHYHNNMSETFTVLEGCLEMEVGAKGNRRILKAGEQLHVPPHTHHSFRNTSDKWITFTSENRPAGQFEQFIRGMFGLAIAGKVNAKGMPTNLFHSALLIKKADLVLVGVPPIIQKLSIALLVKIANWIGIERSLAQYWNENSVNRER
jgi:quercetin dioxygenase-like cupin family protein